MIGPSSDIVTADMLMEQALALLDEQGGEEHAAFLLQHALDTLRRVPAMQEGDELDPALLAHFGLTDPAPSDQSANRIGHGSPTMNAKQAAIPARKPIVPRRTAPAIDRHAP